MAEIGRLFETPSSAGGGRTGGFVFNRATGSQGTSAASGPSNADITKAVQAALAPPAAAATPTVNTAAPNPISNDAITALQGRVTGDMGAGAALDRGIQDIRARASLGIAKEQELNAAARGMSGSSIPGSQAQDLARGQQADISRLTTDITLGREAKRDDMYKSIAQLGLAQGDQQLAAKAQATDQYRADTSAAYDARAAQAQNLAVVLNLLNRNQNVLSPSSGVI